MHHTTYTRNYIIIIGDIKNYHMYPDDVITLNKILDKLDTIF